MKWPFKGKYEGVDVNELDEGYLNWCIENADRNAERADTAEKIKDYRKRHGDNTTEHSAPQSQPAPRSQSTAISAELRAKILECALNTSVEDPWRYIADYEKYVLHGDIPQNESHFINGE